MATTSGVTLVWRTRQVMLPEVRLETIPKSVTMVIPPEGFAIRREDSSETSPGANPLSSAPAGTYQFEAPLTGLKAGTRYAYSIHDAGKCLTPADGSCTFETLPEIGKDVPFSFWVVGDSGTATESQRAVHRAFQKWREKKKDSVP